MKRVRVTVLWRLTWQCRIFFTCSRQAVLNWPNNEQLQCTTEMQTTYEYEEVYSSQSLPCAAADKYSFIPCSPLYPLLWEPQRQVVLRPGFQLDPLGVPALIWPHQPLVRTQSSPASTSLPPPPHPPTTIPSLSLSSSAADVQLRFTTGETLF